MAALPAWLRRTALAAFAAAFFLYFLTFTADGLTSWFSNDDLRAMHYYWVHSWPETLRGNAIFFADFYRPMAGLFYKAVYSVWGFEPEPYRVAALIFVTLNVALLFLVVRRLSDSVEAGAVAVLLTGLNASFVSIYYDTGMIYDVLAFFFYYGAFYYYLRIRRSGKPANTRQTLIFLILLIAALNSKEISVSLPVAILLYELLWNPPRDVGSGRFWHSLWQWSKGPGRVPVLSGAIVAAYIAGKYLGDDSLFKLDPYRPEPSGSMFLTNYAFYLNALSLNALTLAPSAMLGVLAGLLIVGRVAKRRHLVLAAIMVSVSFLPLGFIPPRGGFALYVPSVYWSLWVAGVLVAIREWLVTIFLRLSGRWKQGRPNGKFESGLELLSRAIMWLGLAYAVVPINSTFFGYVLPIVHDVQNRNQGDAMALRQCLPQIPSGSRLLLVDDPYTEEPFIPYFLIREVYEDPTLSVDRSRSLRLRGVEPDPGNYDLIISYPDGRCHVTRQPPGSPN